MSLYTTYTGRLGEICDLVLLLFNDTRMQFVGSQAALLSLVNLCQKDLTQAKYYRTSATLGVTAGTATIDLGETLSGFEAIVDGGLSWAETKEPLTFVQRAQDFETLGLLASGTPLWYTTNGDTLYLAPVPDTTNAAALTVHYYFSPDPLTGLTAEEAEGDPGDPDYVPAVPDGTTPLMVPASHDDVFVYFALMNLYAMDRHAPKADAMFNRSASLYERAKGRLMKRQNEPGIRYRPYR